MSDFPQFFGAAPSFQNALDLFKGEWSTRLPDRMHLTASTGPARLCEDYRVRWAEKELGGFAGQRVLELGPLEAGHTTMLEASGAAEVLAIEANPRAYLKSLVMKEIFGLRRARFMLGDFMEYLRTTSDRFDLGFASGVLYHLHQPIELLELLARTCRSIFVWTQCYDASWTAAHPQTSQRFQAPRPSEYGGFTHTLYPSLYGEALEWKGFCGGQTEGCWLTRDDIVRAAEHFGFHSISVLDESNVNGSALLMTARHD